MKPLVVNGAVDVVRPPGFHAGELAVQKRAGVVTQAARLEGMLGPTTLDGGLGHVLSLQRLAVMTARGRDGHVWTSLLSGEPGFLDGVADCLHVGARPGLGDPLRQLAAGQAVGVLVVDLSRRRRVRINGNLRDVAASGFSIQVVEVFGNCPAYIQQRDVRLAKPQRGTNVDAEAAVGPGQLGQRARQMVEQADTVFLGSNHPVRGLDTSHKGGPPGFVRTDGASIWWPDYAGNNMFNSLGNLQVDPEASLLVPDFQTGEVLQLTGAARIDWVTPTSDGDDGSTGRRVVFEPAKGRVAGGGPTAAEPPQFAAHNPPLSPA